MADYKIGIEEEYFLVDAQTKQVAGDVAPAFFEAAKAATNGRIAREFLQPQIEVVSSPHVSMAEARTELRELRRTVAEIAARHGLATRPPNRMRSPRHACRRAPTTTARARRGRT